ncbi:MAG TPA: flagellin [Bryobacteraceae bacterium]|jgi:flagellin|nr:flagellin [Bryobacteraceae bacterium]
MISIQTNVAALYGLQNLNTNQMNEQNTIEQMTSGYRINSAADDPAGVAMANQLRNAGAELTQGVSNGNNAVGQLQIIDGGLNNVSQILDRLQTLATEGSSSTFTGNFTTLATEFANDVTEISRQAQNVGMNTGGDFNAALSVYVGGGLGNSNGASIGVAVETINLSGTSMAVDAAGLGLSAYTAVSNLTNSANFSAAISAIAAAVTSLGQVQGAVGAGINQLNFAINLAQSQITNDSAAQSTIRDANMAQAATQLSQQQVLMQSAMAALAQANQIPQAVLKLLQG